MTTLLAGDKAPDFLLNNQDGIPVKLDDFLGQKLVIFFYPKDDTPGCTSESCNLRDNYSYFKKNGFEILGVSPDKEKKHLKFIAKYELPFPLLADIDKEMLKAYGVWGEKTFMGRTYDGVHRTTFLIDEKGVISHIITKVKTKVHSDQIKELLKG